MKYLGVDFGLKRVGLAISEGELASPLEVVAGKNLDQIVEQVAKIVKGEKVERIIIGQPESGPVVKAVNEFSKKLHQVAGVEIKIVDETLSTQNASQLMRELGLKKKSRQKNDAAAAALILQNYLDESKLDN